MSDAIIQVNNLSKRFLISHEREAYLALRDKLAHPIEAIKQMKRPREDFWALKDVSFEINQGDVVGIIGPNGSGKSTLLKILSQITPPTRGEAVMKGRVASLLEVGTGFHPELTGRENIYLSGVILGMSKIEIKKHFDEIVDFSGVEKFLDTPVKRYSSGMAVRLGFAVAAHLESEILIVDEVLAVGDAEFQKKCMGKMGDLSSGGDRTILFVSHNMSAVGDLCKSGLCLKSGEVVSSGDINSVINSYLSSSFSTDLSDKFKQPRTISGITKKAIIDNLEIINNDNVNPSNIDALSSVQIKLNISASEDVKTGFYVLIKSFSQGMVLFDSGLMENKLIEIGKNQKVEVVLNIDKLRLTSGSYSIDVGLNIPNVEWHDLIKDAYAFNVSVFDPKKIGANITQSFSKFYCDSEWIIK